MATTMRSSLAGFYLALNHCVAIKGSVSGDLPIPSQHVVAHKFARNILFDERAAIVAVNSVLYKYRIRIEDRYSTQHASQTLKRIKTNIDSHPN